MTVIDGEPMELGSARCSIRPLRLADVDALLDLRLRNRELFTHFEPRRADPDDGFTKPSLEAMVVTNEQAWKADHTYAFGIFHDDRLAGRVSLTNVVRAAWLSSTIGYYVDQALAGRGIATDAVRLAVDFAFDHAALHRVQAAVMPRNGASIRVCEKAGFALEGLARYYLQINGVWEDHHIYSITPELRLSR